MATMALIKRGIDGSVCADVKQMAEMFKHLCENNPEAVKAAMTAHAQRLPRAKQDGLIQLYADKAEYIADLFDYS